MAEDITKKEIRGINISVLGGSIAVVAAVFTVGNDIKTTLTMHEYRINQLEKKAGIGANYMERREIILFDDKKLMTLK